MTLKLPSHVQGWKIPATDRGSELTVIRAGSWIGPHYEVGDLDAELTKVNPKDVRAWLVENDGRAGMAFMEFETDGRSKQWGHGFRAVAAMLHFCVHAEGPDGSGYLPEGGILRVPESTLARMDRRDKMYLENLGLYATYSGSDYIGHPGQIQADTARRFPEFAQAEVLPRRTDEEQAALIAARAAEAQQAPAEQ
jgi:hypothetical protein